MKTALLPLPALLAVFAPLAAAQDHTVAPADQKPVLQQVGIDKLVLGGDMRLRWDSFSNVPPTRSGDSWSTGSGRFRLSLDATVDEHISGFLQVQETVDDRGDAATSYLHQGYATLKEIAGSIEVQAGRFEMEYGNERMISPEDWSQVGRAWDGARAVWRSGDGQWQGDLFWTRPVENQENNPPHSEFGGLYGQWKGAPIAVDAYVLRRNDPFLDDYTWGALVKSDGGPVLWNVEGALQHGDHGTMDALAYAFAARVDWEFNGTGGPRVGAGFEYASGDSDPTDGDSGTFFSLYNSDHDYQGYSDIVLWQNLQDLVVRSWWPIGRGWGVSGDAHFLSLANEDDALYTGVGGSGAVASGNDSNVGTEVDVTLRGQFLNRLQVWTGVAQFFAGDAIRNGDDQFWVFVQTGLTF